jgi:hypothetical protein
VYRRRLQIQLDEPRFRRVEAAAHERRISVAAVIREAIDVALPVDLASKRAAYEALMAEEPIPVPESVGYLKAELDEIRGRGV